MCLSCFTFWQTIKTCFIVAELQTAIDRGDLQALRDAIHCVENMSFCLLLAEEVEAAKRLLKSLERIQGLKEAVLKLDQKTMLELRNYSKPPKMVHQVIKATLRLLGFDQTMTAVSKKAARSSTFSLTKLP